MTILTNLVVTALGKLAKRGAFNPDELAYLALTQKVEHAVRDKLAFMLHRALRNERSLLVCREWYRSDLAIVEGGKPRLIVEAKAVYSFDIIKDGAPHPLRQLVANDLRKAAKRAKDAPPRQPLQTLALIIATHPHTAPE